MVNERVGAGNWESGEELGDTWVSRNAFRCVRVSNNHACKMREQQPRSQGGRPRMGRTCVQSAGVLPSA